MVQMDLIEWMDARTRQLAPVASAAPPPLPERRGLFDRSTGRLCGVTTLLPGVSSPGERARCFEDHDAVLTDARRFGG
jgi:hypothetical protein